MIKLALRQSYIINNDIVKFNIKNILDFIVIRESVKLI